MKTKYTVVPVHSRCDSCEKQVVLLCIAAIASAIAGELPL